MNFKIAVRNVEPLVPCILKAKQAAAFPFPLFLKTYHALGCAFEISNCIGTWEPKGAVLYH